MGDTSGIQLDAPVIEVTLMEDRAMVRRRGTVSLSAGTNHLVIQEVTPVLSDRTLAAALTGCEGVAVNDIRARREPKHRREDRPADHQRIALALEELRNRLRAIDEEVSVLEHQRSQLGAVSEQTVADVAQDTSRGRHTDDALATGLDRLEEKILDLGDRTVELQVERAEAERRLRDLESQLLERQAPDVEIRASIRLELVAAAAGEAVIDVTYVVPAACWRPVYAARLSGETVEMVTSGCVWQRTGEDWPEVSLIFSTERTTRGAAPPILADDLIAMHPKPTETVVVARDETIETTGEGTRPRHDVTEVPGVDDGGVVQRFRPAHRATIPSNGRPHFVVLETSTSKAVTELSALPELAPTAFLVSQQVHEGTHPLMAGPVHLMRESGYAGRTSLLYVAPRERFRLTWGPDPEVRVRRREDSKVEDSTMFSFWERRTVTLRVHLSNIGSKTKQVVVKERLPVSEVETVKIEFDAKGTTGSPRPPDENGFVVWDVELGPNRPRELVLKYVIAKKPEVQGI